MMALFGRLYDWTLRGSAHPRAPWFLALLSFAESSFFPIPPDVMLAPMSLARPHRALHFALLATIASTVGGLAGYAIGHYAMEVVTPIFHDLGYWHSYLKVKSWFAEWGFWIVFVAGFSPIPYKVFTIAAGVLAMTLPLFLLASLVGRAGRFFLVSALMRWGGVRMERMLRDYVDRIGFALVALAVVAYLVIDRL